MNWVIEYHYADGDVGVYPAGEHERVLVEGFSKGDEPSHIVIRPDTPRGQALSDRVRDLHHE